ncbi:MAG: glycosyltransferase family 2 protein [Opitutae bacterium]|nr:glycosyltransferase family 2 protein [Opitutae bacterium]MBT4223407.1 glycosyltransferase family 2 protein [Opitutae bacterium]MBT5381047.1 glycosyltransferase family 2 protein [Opitutae bacterium]MBT5692291.1 glycosyltransferase family 2 protein [Opitutae bacterium]MBT6462891.1 glycosyltransferase family 2 protein [Opitutae bacterium]
MENKEGRNHRAPLPVSIIIPCYNYARFLGAALDSVLAQTYPALEVIVIDDGSPDNTGEVVARYGDRVRYIHQENQGLSASRNNGIQLASHDFIALLDADDEWEPTFLESLMAKMLSLPESFGLVACLDYKIGVDGEVILDRNRDSLTGEVTSRDLLLKNRFFPGAVVIRKALFAQVGGFDTALRSSEDRDMWIRLSAACRLWIIPDKLIRVRKHGNNMSGHGARMRENKKKVLAKARKEGVVGRSAYTFWLQAHSVVDYQTSWIFHGECKHWPALRGIIRSFLLWPLPMNHVHLDVPIFFRIRALPRFILAWLGSLLFSDKDTR